MQIENSLFHTYISSVCITHCTNFIKYYKLDTRGGMLIYSTSSICYFQLCIDMYVPAGMFLTLFEILHRW